MIYIQVKMLSWQTFYTFITLFNSSILYILPVGTALSAVQVDSSHAVGHGGFSGACHSSL